MMPKAPKAFYGVKVGRDPGIYTTWDECEEQVLGFPGAKYKKFATRTDAQTYVGPVSKGASYKPVHSYEDPAPTSVAPISHTSRAITPYSKPRSKEPERGPSSSSSTIDRAIASTSTSATNGKGKNRTVAGAQEQMVVYSDGSCRGNGQDGAVAGIGVWWGPGDPRNLAERCPGAQTNNRAELIAIARTLEEAPRTAPLLIRTDSKYSIQCVRDWLPNWQKNGWRGARGDPVKNAVLIRYIAALLDERGRGGQKVLFEHVKGHAGEVGNEGADRLANEGAMMRQVPDRDWERLQREVENRSHASVDAPLANTSVIADDVTPDDLEAYASGLLSDPEDLEREIMEDD